VRSLARVLVVIAAVILTGVPAIASADEEGTAGGVTSGAYIDESGNPTAEASELADRPDRPAAQPSNCTWQVLGEGQRVYVFDDDGAPIASPTGRWLQKVCNGSPVPVGGVFAVPARPRVDAVDVARRARRSVAIPDPVIATAPPADGKLFVRIPTWLWVDETWWKPYSATASVGGVSATVVATPVRATWSTGDGERVVCDGPGVAWRRGLPELASRCTHEYTRSSAARPGGTFDLAVSVSFEVTWSSSTGAGGRLLPLTRTATRPVQVGEIQAVITR
jgi:hypothetical protein